MQWIEKNNMAINLNNVCTIEAVDVYNSKELIYKIIFLLNNGKEKEISYAQPQVRDAEYRKLLNNVNSTFSQEGTAFKL